MIAGLPRAPVPASTPAPIPPRPPPAPARFWPRWSPRRADRGRRPPRRRTRSPSRPPPARPPAGSPTGSPSRRPAAAAGCRRDPAHHARPGLADGHRNPSRCPARRLRRAAAGVSQGAVVVLDAATGAVRAMAGGRDYRSSSFNRAVTAPAASPARRSSRSSGSPPSSKGARPDDTGPRCAAEGSAPGPRPISSAAYRGEVSLEDALAQTRSTPPRFGCCCRPAARASSPPSPTASASPTSCRTTPRSPSAPARSACWK